MPATRKVVPRKRAQLSNEDSEPESLHSDALDDLPPKKRTRSSNSKSSSPSEPKSKRRKRKAKEDDLKDEDEDEDEDEDDGSEVDLKEGQQVVGRVVQAPKTGWGELVFPNTSGTINPPVSKCLLVRFRRTRLIF
jgi:hypothetical protein